MQACNTFPKQIVKEQINDGKEVKETKNIEPYLQKLLRNCTLHFCYRQNNLMNNRFKLLQPFKAVEVL